MGGYVRGVVSKVGWSGGVLRHWLRFPAAIRGTTPISSDIKHRLVARDKGVASRIILCFAYSSSSNSRRLHPHDFIFFQHCPSVRAQLRRYQSSHDFHVLTSLLGPFPYLFYYSAGLNTPKVENSTPSPQIMPSETMSRQQTLHNRHSRSSLSQSSSAPGPSPACHPILSSSPRLSNSCPSSPTRHLPS